MISLRLTKILPWPYPKKNLKTAAETTLSNVFAVVPSVNMPTSYHLASRGAVTDLNMDKSGKNKLKKQANLGLLFSSSKVICLLNEVVVQGQSVATNSCDLPGAGDLM